MEPFACLYEPEKAAWLNFKAPEYVIAAGTLSEVRDALAEVQRLVEDSSLWAVGFIAYEAAPAFDPAMQAHPPAADLPLVWFGLFPAPALSASLPATNLATQISSGNNLAWRPALERAAYDRAIEAIKAQIAAGNTYQVNYTLRLQAQFPGDPWPFFQNLVQVQQGLYSAYIRTDRHVVCSASPELFFEQQGEMLVSRPMKGTAGRGRTPAEDQARMDWLKRSEKNRAENVMIVDMIRNDMGRIARPSSVSVRRLFEVERYPTILQMTSTVESRTQAEFPQIIEALFPCASITGAPKIRTMEIIRQLEPGPRGVYTGAIGWLAPGRQARFNVAIRTMVLDCRTRQAEFGTGSGIVWDSDTTGEYAESLLKANVLTETRPEFSLLESLLWTPQSGYFLLERHLERMAASADYFGFSFDPDRVRRSLDKRAGELPDKPYKIRLLLSRRGTPSVEALVLPDDFCFSAGPQEAPSRTCALGTKPVDAQDVSLFHKTTDREVYEVQGRDLPQVDHVLLWNRAGELTETATANLVFQIDEKWFTPPVDCGLLAGTYREELLAAGHLAERRLLKTDLGAVENLWAVNSVRGWQQLTLTY